MPGTTCPEHICRLCNTYLCNSAQTVTIYNSFNDSPLQVGRPNSRKFVELALTILEGWSKHRTTEETWYMGDPAWRKQI